MDTVELLSVHPLIADRTRLAIMAALAGSGVPLEFTYLLESLSLTKGNLSTHLRRLEDEKLIEAKRVFVDRKSRSTYNCTARGRRELEHYLESVESALRKLKKRPG